MEDGRAEVAVTLAECAVRPVSPVDEKRGSVWEYLWAHTWAPALRGRLCEAQEKPYLPKQTSRG